MEYQRDEHRVHLIVYHLIWCSKRRKPALTGKVAVDCRKLIETKCEEHAWHADAQRSATSWPWGVDL